MHIQNVCVLTTPLECYVHTCSETCLCVNVGSEMHLFLLVGGGSFEMKCIARLPLTTPPPQPPLPSMMFLNVLWETICSVQNTHLLRWVICTSSLAMNMDFKSGAFPGHQIPNGKVFASIVTYIHTHTHTVYTHARARYIELNFGS